MRDADAGGGESGLTRRHGCSERPKTGPHMSTVVAGSAARSNRSLRYFAFVYTVSSYFRALSNSCKVEMWRIVEEGIILKKLFGKKREDEIFEKIHDLLYNEEEQNKRYLPALRDTMKRNGKRDSVMYGVGEYGRCPSNAIPVNGMVGALAYLSLLRHEQTNQRVIFHRLGSTEMMDLKDPSGAHGRAEPVDVYQSMTPDGKHWDILYLSAYYEGRSRQAPSGYVVVTPRENPLIWGTNDCVESFPKGIADATKRNLQEKTGIPLAPRMMEHLIKGRQVTPPREHWYQFKTAMAHMGFAVSMDES